MNTKKEQVLSAIHSVSHAKERFQLSDVLKKLTHATISRQYVSTLLSDLVANKTLISAGTRRHTFYALPENIDALRERHGWTLTNQGLKEYEVYQDAIVGTTPFLQKLPDNSASIVNYAFSEMLNNAIEHSKSPTIDVIFYREDGFVTFVVRDYGIGVFESVRQKHQLNDDLEAIQELLKGKTTTAPKAHSGEGIFFTSKAADLFMLDSYERRLRIDNSIDDIFVENRTRNLKGTKVTFSIKEKTKKHLSDLFRQYQSSPESLAFDKTLIHIKLYTMGTVYISRSQARRVLSGLAKKYKVIVLDFDKVPTVGQAFADEVFRVFKSAHPGISVRAVNMNTAVDFMIQRAINTARGS